MSAGTSQPAAIAQKTTPLFAAMPAWHRFFDKQLTAILLSLLLHFTVFFAVAHCLQPPAPLHTASMSVKFISASVITTAQPSPPSPQNLQLTATAASVAADMTTIVSPTTPTSDNSRTMPTPKPVQVPSKAVVATPLPLTKPEKPQITQPLTQHITQHIKQAAEPAQSFTAHPLTNASSVLNKQAAIAPIQPQTSAAEFTDASPSEPLALPEELAVNCPHRPAPAYPGSARRLRESGTVLVKVWLNAEGKVADAKLVQSSGYPRLDQAALATVQLWRCHAPTRNGQPATAVALQPFLFDLNK